MAKATGNSKNTSETRQQLLRAALKRFAHSGYAASSVQHIVDEAKVSKPALYYHFRDKAGLFEALVHEAHEERFRVMQAAVAKGGDFRQQAENILIGLFECFRKNRELMRIAFATMFAAPGEVPESFSCTEKCERNFDFLLNVFKRAQKNGELDKSYDSQELTFGFYGLANVYLVGHLIRPDCELDDLTAKKVVELFLAGAAPKKRGQKS